MSTHPASHWSISGLQMSTDADDRGQRSTSTSSTVTLTDERDTAPGTHPSVRHHYDDYDNDSPITKQRGKGHAVTPSRELLLPPRSPSVDCSDPFDAESQQNAPSRLGRLKAIIWDPNAAFLIMASSQGLFATMNVLVKWLSLSDVRIPTWELILTRMSVTWICGYAYMRWKGVEYPLTWPPKLRKWLMLRGAVGQFGLAGMYLSLLYLSLTDATSLTFLSPFLTGILAAVLLGEPYLPIEALAGLISLGGVVLIAKPAFLFSSGDPVDSEETHRRTIGVLISLMGVLGSAGAYTTIRKMGKDCHPLHSVNAFSVFCCLGAIIMHMILPDEPLIIPKEPIFYLILFSIGIIGFLAQFLLNIGLQMDKSTGTTLLACYLQAPYSIAYQTIVFREPLTLTSLAGSAIIIASAAYVMIVRNRNMADKDEPPSTEVVSLLPGGPDKAELSQEPDVRTPQHHHHHQEYEREHEHERSP
ncbi:uncharacterized protein L969DRAFT_45046 [Mixia osmundae IAM 14324]|uniref:EamA domain-containing protein n=1 Tax=Mixia osmundae (strain CBS 9802 / IAM 14324 / JCM 22182 / KY 12970) TaxID=764103 RepID=G7DYA7_MIXOS|nr:uncharacterized protein L969DRAFT_45046 [Mixia osmundae IAM 14324]KEI41469.1 hypothetical protein L969DRAFT_45046 [Mixia osmundae IAM 14324]GAA95567.1 hypothetical protein E5Q_02222 [Mixia osmundae IAM 14324]